MEPLEAYLCDKTSLHTVLVFAIVKHVSSFHPTAATQAIGVS